MAMTRIPKPPMAKIHQAASRVDKAAASHAPKIVSPWKLAKHDIQHQHTAVTWGPKGKPSAGCSGSICYRHPTVDWTVHRYVPAIHESAPKGGRTQRVLSNVNRFPSKEGRIGRKIVDKYPALEGVSKKDSKHTGKFLLNSSPRWGPGKAPGRTPRKTVPLPSDRYISHRTMGVAAGAVAVGGGMYAYHHRQEIKAKAAGFADKHPHFAKSINYHSKGA